MSGRCVRHRERTTLRRSTRGRGRSLAIKVRMICPPKSVQICRAHKSWVVVPKCKCCPRQILFLARTGSRIEARATQTILSWTVHMFSPIEIARPGMQSATKCFCQVFAVPTFSRHRGLKRLEWRKMTLALPIQRHKRSHACWGEPEMHCAKTQSVVAFGGCDEISGRRHWPAERMLQESQVDTHIAQNKHFQRT